jgi:hypothetical protein
MEKLAPWGEDFRVDRIGSYEAAFSLGPGFGAPQMDR